MNARSCLRRGCPPHLVEAARRKWVERRGRGRRRARRARSDPQNPTQAPTRTAGCPKVRPGGHAAPRSARSAPPRGKRGKSWRAEHAGARTRSPGIRSDRVGRPTAPEALRRRRSRVTPRDRQKGRKNVVSRRHQRRFGRFKDRCSSFGNLFRRYPRPTARTDHLSKNRNCPCFKSCFPHWLNCPCSW